MAKGLTDAWRTINLSTRFRAPVVIVTPNYGAGAPALVPRLRDITDLTIDHQSFDIRLQRLDSQAAVPPIDVNYLVVEAGVYNKSHHGIDLESMRFNASATDSARSWVGMPRKYVNSYSQPVVLGEVLSSNNTRFSSFWSRGATATEAPSSSALYVGKHVGEDTSRSRSSETVGYIVTESGAGEMNGQRIYAGVSGSTVAGVGDAPPYLIPLSGLASASSAHISQMGMRGTNGSQALLYGAGALSPTAIKAAVDEDQLADAERSHELPERVGYLVFGSPTGAATAAPPTFEPAPGSFLSSVDVTINSTTPSANLWYTTDGSDPITSAQRILYEAPVTLTSTAMLRAVAQAPGYQDSAVVDAAYTIVGSGTGSLTSVVDVAPSAVNLTTSGPLDWIHWGRVSRDVVDRKAGVTPRISTLSPLGGVNSFVSTSASAGYTWTDGTPLESISGNKTGLRINPVIGGGWQFTIPADATAKTLKIYVGLNNARGKLSATLSDASAPEHIVLIDQPSGKASRVATLSFNAAGPGETLTVKFTLDAVYAGTYKWIMLESATLAE
jgi:hypothetical protein